MSRCSHFGLHQVEPTLSAGETARPGLNLGMEDVEDWKPLSLNSFLVFYIDLGFISLTLTIHTFLFLQPASKWQNRFFIWTGGRIRYLSPSYEGDVSPSASEVIMTNPSGLAPQAVRDTKCSPARLLCSWCVFTNRYRYQLPLDRTISFIGWIWSSINTQCSNNFTNDIHGLRYVSTPWPRWGCSDVGRVGMKWWPFGPCGSHETWHIAAWWKDLMFYDFGTSVINMKLPSTTNGWKVTW